MFRKNKDNKKLYRLFSALLFLALLFFAYNKTHLGKNIDKFINRIFVYNVYVFDKILERSSSVIKRISLNNSFYKENLLLRHELNQLRNQIEDTELYVKNHKTLIEECGYYNSIENNIITTELFSVTPGPYVKEAYIAAGKEIGVESGDIVLYRRMLFGRVIEVYKDFAKVLLIFDSRSKISAITETTRTKILLEGNNSNKLIIKYLPETEKINGEEFVETSNYCSLFPSGIKIGLVNVQNIKSPYVLVPYKIKNVKYVQIIRNITK